MSEPMRMSAERRIRPGRKASAAGVAFALTLSAGVQLTGLAGSSAAAAPAPIGIDAGSGSGYTTQAGFAFDADRGFSGGGTYTAPSWRAIAGTDDDALYRSTRVGMSGYRLAVPASGTYEVELHLAELQTGGETKRVFDVTAEGTERLSNIDIYKQYGRYTAVTKAFDVSVTDGSLDLGFPSTSTLGAAVAAIRVTPVLVTAPAPTAAPTTAAPTPAPSASTTPTATPTTAAPTVAPTTAAPTAAPTTAAPVPVADAAFPTLESTGPRVALSTLTPSGPVTSSRDGQVIERKDITGNLRIVHDNVVVRDSRISFTSTHGLTVVKKADGTCPVGTRFEYVDVDGRLAAEADIPVYSPGCGWTLDHAYVHNVGRTSRLTNDNTVSNSYVFSNRTGDSGAHRGAVGTNGGRNNKIVNNVLMCQGTGCSAAIPMYGDFAPVDGMLVQHNLMATTGSYCAYGGTLSSKKYPLGSNVKFIDNHFSTRFMAKCGRYGHISGFANGVRGNEWRGNVWHETGQAA